MLRFVEGRSIDEVAQRTNVSIATARRRYVRAATRLRLLAERDLFLSDYTPQLAAAADPSAD